MEPRFARRDGLASLGGGRSLAPRANTPGVCTGGSPERNAPERKCVTHRSVTHRSVTHGPPLLTPPGTSGVFHHRRKNLDGDIGYPGYRISRISDIGYRISGYPRLSIINIYYAILFLYYYSYMSIPVSYIFILS